MILIVGAGSFLAGTLSSSNLFEGEPITYVSRGKPNFAEESNWICTEYSIDDGSIEGLRAITDVTCVVWLASPCHRSLLVSQSAEQIGTSLDSGTKYQTLAVRALLPDMIKRRHGRFIFVGSSGAKAGAKGAVVYMQTKAAQSALSTGIALEYGRLGITSNVLSVGLLNGGLHDSLGEDEKVAMLLRTSSEDFVDTEDFWSTVKLLNESGSINGAEIAIDRGYR